MSPWDLPTTAVIGGREYELNADFRDILDILYHLEDPDEPEFLRWQIALALFYEGYDQMPAKDQQEAMEYLALFLTGGQAEEQNASVPKLIDWDQDAQAIVSDVNKVAGCEIRALPFLHWWSFLAFFQGIGEGQLSTRVSIRDKLRRGKPLEKWELDFYRQNKEQVDLKRRYSAGELEEQERLNELLNGGDGNGK